MSELLKINVNDHLEKKNGLSYLSWAWAWAEVLKIDPAATWEPMTFGGQGEGFQLLCAMPDGTAFVGVTVTVNKIQRSCLLPVMDHRNKAIPKPNAFDVNKAVMRCLAKAIAMHGLGLYVYAGEDLPEGEEEAKTTAHPPAKLAAEDTPIDPETKKYVEEVGADMLAAWTEGNELAVLKAWRSISDNDIKIHLWAWLASESKLRAFLKANGKAA